MQALLAERNHQVGVGCKKAGSVQKPGKTRVVEPMPQRQLGIPRCHGRALSQGQVLLTSAGMSGHCLERDLSPWKQPSRNHMNVPVGYSLHITATSKPEMVYPKRALNQDVDV